jgi:hypothetical protein
MYTRVRKEHKLIVGVYVDDLIILGKSHDEVSLFKKEMKEIFHTSDLGAMPYYLALKSEKGRMALG